MSATQICWLQIVCSKCPTVNEMTISKSVNRIRTKFNHSFHLGDENIVSYRQPQFFVDNSFLFLLSATENCTIWIPQRTMDLGLELLIQINCNCYNYYLFVVTGLNKTHVSQPQNLEFKGPQRMIVAYHWKNKNISLQKNLLEDLT